MSDSRSNGNVRFETPHSFSRRMWEYECALIREAQAANEALKRAGSRWAIRAKGAGHGEDSSGLEVHAAGSTDGRGSNHEPHPRGA